MGDISYGPINKNRTERDEEKLSLGVIGMYGNKNGWRGGRRYLSKYITLTLKKVKSFCAGHKRMVQYIHDALIQLILSQIYIILDQGLIYVIKEAINIFKAIYKRLRT